MQPLSLSVARIEMLRQDGATSIAGAIGTAFFYSSAESIFVVTNWHNITVINPETGKALHSQGFVPNVLRVHYKCWFNTEKTILKSNSIDIALYKDEKPIWFEHSQRAEVDVVALLFPIAEIEDFANNCINLIEHEPDLQVTPGMDCFILGFPKGLFGAAFTPIWKRGSIAAEPYLQHPYVIDAATREGMSGSPVIVRHSGFFGSGGVLTGKEVIGTVEKFVAIYSSRIGADELGGQLGRAWQSNALDDVLTLATPGRHPMAECGAI